MFWELVDIFLRGYRLRCPCCGHGKLFKSFVVMHECCAACDERFEREPGQWFGAVYVNLVLTLGLAIIGYVGLQTFTSITLDQQLAIWTPVAATGPFVFYRLSKGLWTSLVFLGEGLYLRWPTRTEKLTPYGRRDKQSSPERPRPVS